MNPQRVPAPRMAVDPVLWNPAERADALRQALNYAESAPSLPSMTVYALLAEKTHPILAHAFAQGGGGWLSFALQPQPGVPVMMPSPDAAACDFFQRHVRAQPRWIALNKGYLSRGIHFRAVVNGLQVDLERLDRLGVPPRESCKRFDKLRIPIRPWRKTGRHILLCPNSPRWFEMQGTTFDAWHQAVTATLRAHTDRPIVVRWKRDAILRPMAQDLRNAWAVVVFDSVAGVEAALAGVPVFATEPCAACAFGCGDLARIEAPRYPSADKRRALSAWLAANQWTLAEMRAGMAWAQLREAAQGAV